MRKYEVLKSESRWGSGRGRKSSLCSRRRASTRASPAPFKETERCEGKEGGGKFLDRSRDPTLLWRGASAVLAALLPRDGDP